MWLLTEHQRQCLTRNVILTPQPSRGPFRTFNFTFPTKPHAFLGRVCVAGMTSYSCTFVLSGDDSVDGAPAALWLPEHTNRYSFSSVWMQNAKTKACLFFWDCRAAFRALIGSLEVVPPTNAHTLCINTQWQTFCAAASLTRSHTYFYSSNLPLVQWFGFRGPRH